MNILVITYLPCYQLKFVSGLLTFIHLQNLAFTKANSKQKIDKQRSHGAEEVTLAIDVWRTYKCGRLTWDAIGYRCLAPGNDIHNCSFSNIRWTQRIIKDRYFKLSEISPSLPTKGATPVSILNRKSSYSNHHVHKDHNGCRPQTRDGIGREQWSKILRAKLFTFPNGTDAELRAD